MTLFVIVVGAFVVITFFLSPFVGAAVERRRREATELRRCGGVVRPINTAPHWTPDPSPTPRRGGDAA